ASLQCGHCSDQKNTDSAATGSVHHAATRAILAHRRPQPGMPIAELAAETGFSSSRFFMTQAWLINKKAAPLV
ncbi:MAG: hypothetical protein ACNA75_11980, partial [Thiohalomonadaceae bacterium]